ncbi:MAG TPA: hypothetical protein VK210_08855 [Terriglobia bacterium]|nr:hypothetical protein [Terriglobia bacterium]
MNNRRSGFYLSLLLLPVVLTAFLGFHPLQSEAADTLPAQLPDAEFWRLVTEFSEPNGAFPYENFVSNEREYQNVLTELTQKGPVGGVYLGVAPEQNFTYIAALKPRMAFIIDIRRQNMIELLMYKALFEMSKDRSDFVTRLFSRKCPATVNGKSGAKELFQACGGSAPDSALFETTLQAIKDRLIKEHKFQLTADDESRIKYVFNVFYTGGPQMDYMFASPSHPNASNVPNYYDLMIAADSQGTRWSYLDKEDAYQRVRTMQQKNLIVPIVGDFGGPKALRAIGQYLKDHGSTVSVFYISNVEDYLQSKWQSYRANIAALPTEPTSMFIRVFIDMPRTFTAPMNALPASYPGRSFQ